MSIVYCKKTRRQFLLGAGKTMLALPMLTSLMPVEAFAQTAEAPRRMMLFWFDHGNLDVLWPQRSITTTAIGSFGAREVPLRTLARSAISPVFSNVRYEAIKNANQLTMVRGFDLAQAYGPAHGNQGLHAGEGRFSEGAYPTIDTIIEKSPAVYPSSTPSSVRKIIRLIHANRETYFYEKVGTRVQELPAYNDEIPNFNDTLQTFYREVFAGLTGGTTAPVDNTNLLKSNILNRVYPQFASFKTNRRISSDDRARLDQHMGFLSDLQKSFAAAQPAPQVSCARPNKPATIEANSDATIRLYYSLLAIAFKCGLTKFGAMRVNSYPDFLPGYNVEADFHESIHGVHGNTNQQKAFTFFYNYHFNAIADTFLASLDEQEGNTGRTYLDNMLTGMISQAGVHSLGNDGGHSGLDSQQILIGSMGGRVRSGGYLAYPNNGDLKRAPYNCFLITLMHLMGVQPSEYAFATGNGQGFGYYGGFPSDQPFRSRFYLPLSELLT